MTERQKVKNDQYDISFFSLKFFLCTVVVSMNKVMPTIIFVSMASVIFDVIIFGPSENS